MKKVHWWLQISIISDNELLCHQDKINTFFIYELQKQLLNTLL